MVMWRKFDQFIPETDFVAWGVAIARNLVLDFRKKKKPVYLADEALQLLDMESDILLKDQNLRLDALKKCVKKLQPKDRSLVHLRYTENVCVRSIARRFGQHQRSIYKNLARIQDGLLRCVNRTLREIVT